MSDPVSAAFQGFKSTLIVRVFVGSREAHKDHAALRWQADPEGQFAEVLVVRQDDALFGLRSRQDCLVLFATQRFLDRQNIGSFFRSASMTVRVTFSLARNRIGDL